MAALVLVRPALLWMAALAVLMAPLLLMAETCGTVVGGELPKELKFGLDDPEI